MVPNLLFMYFKCKLNYTKNYRKKRKGKIKEVNKRKKQCKQYRNK